MREDKVKILRMLEEGKIKAEEAARLLEALNGPERSAERAKWLRIRVYDKDEDEPKVKVNLPFSLLKLFTKIGKFKDKIPSKVQERLREKGIELDEEGLENLDKLIEEAGAEGKVTIADVVDEEDGQKVEIYLE
jgi:hypothetical protein